MSIPSTLDLPLFRLLADTPLPKRCAAECATGCGVRNQQVTRSSRVAGSNLRSPVNVRVSYGWQAMRRWTFLPILSKQVIKRCRLMKRAEHVVGVGDQQLRSGR